MTPDRQKKTEQQEMEQQESLRILQQTRRDARINARSAAARLRASTTSVHPVHEPCADPQQTREAHGEDSSSAGPRIKAGRGTETLFRNAYRAQLDMLTLAATKANIMISLNGLLLSMLIISGTYFMSVDGLYIVPIGLFLITCAIATFFAVAAARPDISRKTFNRDDFEHDFAHLLLYEEFSDLEEGEYIDAMTNLLTDRQRVYRNMIAHVYELGSTADRKYRQLYYSYTVFFAGLFLTVAVMLLLLGLRWSGLLVSIV